MKVLLSHVYAWPEVQRGGERYLHQLAAALRDRGHDVQIITTASGVPWRDDILGVPVRALRRRRLRPGRFGPHSDEVAFGLQALAHALPRDYDVWHALGTSDAAAAAIWSRIRRRRSVYTDLGIPLGTYRRSRPDHGVFRFVVDHVDRYVCLSRHAAAQLARDFGRSPLVVGGGVDLGAFEPAPARHPVPTLLFVSALDEPRKGLGLFLEAVARLRLEVPELEVRLLGGGDGSSTLADAPPAARDAVVEISCPGPDELHDWYGRAAATVLPAHKEAFGLVLLESLACGTPVVCLAEGGPAEFVTDEVGARSAADPVALAAACRRAIDLSTRPGIVDRCRSVARRFDVREAIAPRFEELYR